MPFICKPTSPGSYLQLHPYLSHTPSQSFHCLKHPEGQASGNERPSAIIRMSQSHTVYAVLSCLAETCCCSWLAGVFPLWHTLIPPLGPGSVINFFRPVSFSFPPTAAPTLSYRIKHTHFLKQTSHHTFVHENLVPQWCLSLIHTSKFLIIIKIRNLLDLMYNWAYQRLW